ncbi:MAG: DUF177 domain-containing protein [Bacteroidetes bacterium]|nr:DUF177 domain-containing protein [Bacteroidota bacterium]
MKYEREFILPLTGSSLGPKTYDFDLGSEFLAFSQFPEAESGEVHLSLVLDKQPAFIAMEFNYKGWLKLNCDRCAEDYIQPINGTFRYLLKYGDHLEEESEDVMLIPRDLHEYDVFQLVYEYLMLLVPMRKVHLPDAHGQATCNPEVLALLERLKPEASVDPRWSQLQSLIKPDEEPQTN